MLSDDLTAAIAARSDPGVGFRQGVVIAWNQLTNANTVDVGGTWLTDVPSLAGRPPVVGETVALLTWKSSWFVLGPIPGTVTRPHAARTKTGAQTLAHNVYEVVDWDTESAPSGGGITYNAVSGKFTMPRPGRVDVFACIAFAVGGGGARGMRILRAGSQVAEGPRTAASTVAATGGFIADQLAVDQNSTLRFDGIQNSGADLNIVGSSTFNRVRISYID